MGISLSRNIFSICIDRAYPDVELPGDIFGTVFFEKQFDDLDFPGSKLWIGS